MSDIPITIQVAAIESLVKGDQGPAGGLGTIALIDAVGEETIAAGTGTVIADPVLYGQAMIVYLPNPVGAGGQRVMVYRRTGGANTLEVQGAGGFSEFLVNAGDYVYATSDNASWVLSGEGPLDATDISYDDSGAAQVTGATVQAAIDWIDSNLGGGGGGITAEQARDTIATMFDDGTQTGLTVTHNDIDENSGSFDVVLDFGRGPGQVLQGNDSVLDDIQYTTNKGDPNGYAQLDGLGHVPEDELGSGTGTGVKVLWGDSRWAVINHGDIADIVDDADPHPMYLLETAADATIDARIVAYGAATATDIANAVTAHEALGDPHPLYALEANLGTSSAFDVPSSGNAAVGEVVKGDDTRLSLLTHPDWAQAGDLVMGAADNTASILSRGTDGQILKLVSGLPSWENESAGGNILTDDAWLAEGDLIIGDDPDAAKILSIGSNGQVLKVVGGTLAWAADDDTDTVYGGVLGDDAWLAEGDLLVGDAADTGKILGIGSNGQVLKVVGGELAWAADDDTDTVYPGVATDSAWAADGDLLLGTGDDTSTVLSKGSEGAVLGVNGGNVEWVSIPSYILASIADAEGDMLVATADNTWGKLTKGTDGLFLKAGASTLEYGGVSDTDVTRTTAALGITGHDVDSPDIATARVFTRALVGDTTATNFQGPGTTGAVEGDQIVLKITGTTGATQAPTMDTGSAGDFSFGTDITDLSGVSLGNGVVSYVGCFYDATAQRWNVVSVVAGY